MQPSLDGSYVFMILKMLKNALEYPIGYLLVANGIL